MKVRQHIVFLDQLCSHGIYLIEQNSKTLWPLRRCDGSGVDLNTFKLSSIAFQPGLGRLLMSASFHTFHIFLRSLIVAESFSFCSLLKFIVQTLPLKTNVVLHCCLSAMTIKVVMTVSLFTIMSSHSV